MLTQLRKGLRSRVAGVLVVLYALCLLAPAAAFAFGDVTKAAHCLTDDSHGLGTSHAKEHGQHDGVAHQHPGEVDVEKTNSGQ